MRSEPRQTFKLEFFAKIVNGFQLLSTLSKASILDVLMDSECTSETLTWRGTVVAITSAQVHSTELKIRFREGSNFARSVSGIYDSTNHFGFSKVSCRLSVSTKIGLHQLRFPEYFVKHFRLYFLQNTCGQLFLSLL